MNRDEQLKFCEICTNRQFDAQQGIICQLTGARATFETTCENYSMDQLALAKAAQQENSEGAVDFQGRIMDEGSMNNIPIALIGGIAAAMVSAMLWGYVTVLTNYQIGYMAVGVGFLVGIAVRFFGRGIRIEFAIIGSALAFFGTILGNLFSIIALTAQDLGTSYMGVFDHATFAEIISFYFENFSLIDILFYGIAISTAFKMSLAIRR